MPSARIYSCLFSAGSEGDAFSSLPCSSRNPTLSAHFHFSGLDILFSHRILLFLIYGTLYYDCRVHLKPYAELKDSDGRPDEEVAHEVQCIRSDFKTMCSANESDCVINF